MCLSYYVLQSKLLICLLVSKKLTNFVKEIVKNRSHDIEAKAG